MSNLRIFARTTFLGGILALSTIPTSAFCQIATDQTSASKPASTQWFEDARFGVFIHWGLYSESGGEWKGKRFYGITEWMMRRNKIPLRDYATLASHFDPIGFDARAWARTIKAAGARYLVITTKHHDGFAMYASKANRYNIKDATPFHRDTLRELVDAARAEGLKIGFYYSQVQDWADKDAVGNDWDFPAKDRNFQAYLDRKAIPQIRELLTDYGPVDIVWFDTPMTARPSDSKLLYNLVKSLQPNCLVSSRIGNGLGDYSTFGDGEIPAAPPSTPPWEAIFTHNDSWGFSKFDRNFKSDGELIGLIATAASKGGNTLINIGPDGTGRMPEESIARFTAVGDWLKANGASIYGTQGVPLTPSPWGVATRRDDRLFLHVLHHPADGLLVVPGIKDNPDRVTLLVDGRPLKWKRNGEDLIVTLPAVLPDARDTVVAIDGAGPIVPIGVAAILSRQYPDLTLNGATAVLAGAATHKSVSYRGYFGDWKYIDSIDGLKSPADTARWTIRVDEPGDYKLTLTYSGEPAAAGEEGFVDVAGQTFSFQVLDTGATDPAERPITFTTQGLGLVHFDKPGRYEIVLRPRQVGSNLVRLRGLTFTPAI